MFKDLPEKRRNRLSNTVKAVMADWYGFDLTTEHVADLLDYNHGQWLTDILVNGLDTCVREGMADTLSEKLVGKRWPLGDDDDETYWTKLAEGAERYGYKPTPNAYWNLKERSASRDLPNMLPADFAL